MINLLSRFDCPEFGFMRDNVATYLDFLFERHKTVTYNFRNGRYVLRRSGTYGLEFVGTRNGRSVDRNRNKGIFSEIANDIARKTENFEDVKVPYGIVSD